MMTRGSLSVYIAKSTRLQLEMEMGTQGGQVDKKTNTTASPSNASFVFEFIIHSVFKSFLSILSIFLASLILSSQFLS